MGKKTDESKIILKPNPNCKVCLGRGWVRYVVPENQSKEVRPCPCVKAKVNEWPDMTKNITQAIL